ncbi:MAG: AI-2E family transporter [Lactobacillaceae bacterium]|nr:AI-2E family transporter [Lactobacillaceae bacterium]
MRKEIKENKTWLEKWVFNNRLVSSLLVVILFLLLIFMINKVDFIFKPLSALFAAVGAPLLTAGVFYFLLNPIVEWIEKKTAWPKTAVVSLIFVILAFIVVILVVWITPIIRDSIASFINNWPDFYHSVARKINEWSKYESMKPIKNVLEDTNNDINSTVLEWSKTYLSTGFIGLGKVVKVTSVIFITLLTFPIILFYLLKDASRLPLFVQRLAPRKTHASLLSMMNEMNKQISDYVRGQILTGVAVSILFMIGFSIVGLPYGIWIGLLAGPLNLIPFLGSFLAMIPAIILAVLNGTHMIIAVLIVFAIEQTLESRVIHPLIMADSMNVHPVTILVILLAAGEMFGLLGVAFGIPAYAVLKVVVSHIYTWWKENSSLFKS